MSSVILRGQPKPSLISHALSIVRPLLATEQFRKAGLTTAEMYRLALKEAPPPNFEKYAVHENRDTDIRYTKSGQRKNPPPSPPHMEHPIRSMRFLKSQILPMLEGLKEIRMTTGTRSHAAPEVKVNFGSAKTKTKAKGKGNGYSKPDVASSSTASTTISHTVHLWMPTQKAKVTKTIENKPTPSDVFGTEVGRGADWDHLNRHRQRTRDEKVKHDVDVMAQVRKAEKQEKKKLLWEAFMRKKARDARAPKTVVDDRISDSQSSQKVQV
ncbi:hypothetical protein F5050DRAFT_1803924 [Lentinula boryana]|uniref:MRPL25 domain-containing protein n=1 Tax=Lentinula boryana TaxID=40481 RepID=A0ABQ8QPW8_9AGAR|nr:hypothetical protein F5050DRAFT_1803924 [Lentinula boryana]